MVVTERPTLRCKLTEVFNELFENREERLVVLADLSDKKSATNSESKERSCCFGKIGAISPFASDAGDAASKSRVLGQSIIGLFEAEDVDVDDIAPARFMNGDSIGLEHNVNSFVEFQGEKLVSKKIFAAERYAPSDALIVASVNCFSRKKKRHFFRDALYLCAVFAKEMEMTLTTFLQVRGWLVTKNKGTLSISYRRIQDCLRILGKAGAENYFRISAMFDRLFRTIYSREIWPKMAYEEESKIYVEFSLIILA